MVAADKGMGEFSSEPTAEDNSLVHSIGAPRHSCKMGLLGRHCARLGIEVQRVLGEESQSRFVLRNWMMPGTDAVTVPPESERWAGERCLYILRWTAGSQSGDRGEAIPGGHMDKDAVLREAPGRASARGHDSVGHLR